MRGAYCVVRYSYVWCQCTCTEGRTGEHTSGCRPRRQRGGGVTQYGAVSCPSPLSTLVGMSDGVAEAGGDGVNMSNRVTVIAGAAVCMGCKPASAAGLWSYQPRQPASLVTTAIRRRYRSCLRFPATDPAVIISRHCWWWFWVAVCHAISICRGRRHS